MNETEQFAEVIYNMIIMGHISREDLMPALKKGTAKSLNEPEDKIFKKEESCCGHWSDCAVHNEPAYRNGECTCGVNTPHPHTLADPTPHSPSVAPQATQEESREVNGWEERFENSFDTKHSQMTHIGKSSIRRADCEVCQKQKVDNPKGYYKTFLSEQKCYWNDEMFKDVKAFIASERELARREEREKILREQYEMFLTARKNVDAPIGIKIEQFLEIFATANNINLTTE